jgi:hypothetical protein
MMERKRLFPKISRTSDYSEISQEMERVKTSNAPAPSPPCGCSSLLDLPYIAVTPHMRGELLTINCHSGQLFDVSARYIVCFA